MKRLIYATVVCASLLVFAGQGWADVVTLQQGLNNYTGVADTFTGHGGSAVTPQLDLYENGGQFTMMNAYSDQSTIRVKSLIKFDLTGALPGVTDASQITSAQLFFYRVGGNAPNSPGATLSRVNQAWQEGTWDSTGDANWTRAVLSGASETYRTAAHFADANAGNKVAGYNTIYQTTVPAGATVAHAGYGSDYNFGSFVAKSDLAALDNSNGWYQDGTTLYVSLTHGGVTPAVGMGYYLDGEQWGATFHTADPFKNTANATWTASSWNSFNVTDWAKDWFTNPAGNFGVALAGGGGELSTFSSQYAADSTLRPYLLLEVVPEPATVALLALGGMAALLRRRRHAA